MDDPFYYVSSAIVGPLRLHHVGSCHHDWFLLQPCCRLLPDRIPVRPVGQVFAPLLSGSLGGRVGLFPPLQDFVFRPRNQLPDIALDGIGCRIVGCWLRCGRGQEADAGAIVAVGTAFRGQPVCPYPYNHTHWLLIIIQYGNDIKHTLLDF